MQWARVDCINRLFESGDERGRSEEEGAIGERCGTSTQSTEELLRVASLGRVREERGREGERGERERVRDVEVMPNSMFNFRD